MMDRQPYNLGDRHLNWQIALFSILGFWLLYVLIVTLRAYVVDFPAQGEMAIRNWHRDHHPLVAGATAL
jgi:hypothetical protein